MKLTIYTCATALLTKLPPPDLLSLKPIFQMTPPPQLSTTSFRALPKPVYNDDVTPERETWQATAGWGSWNVLRRAIEGLDVSLLFPWLVDARICTTRPAPSACRTRQCAEPWL